MSISSEQRSADFDGDHIRRVDPRGTVAFEDNRFARGDILVVRAAR